MGILEKIQKFELKKEYKKDLTFLVLAFFLASLIKKKGIEGSFVDMTGKTIGLWIVLKLGVYLDEQF